MAFSVFGSLLTASRSFSPCSRRSGKRTDISPTKARAWASVISFTLLPTCPAATGDGNWYGEFGVGGPCRGLAVFRRARPGESVKVIFYCLVELRRGYSESLLDRLFHRNFLNLHQPEICPRFR